MFSLAGTLPSDRDPLQTHLGPAAARGGSATSPRCVRRGLRRHELGRVAGAGGARGRGGELEALEDGARGVRVEDSAEDAQAVTAARTALDVDVEGSTEKVAPRHAARGGVELAVGEPIPVGDGEDAGGEKDRSSLRRAGVGPSALDVQWVLWW
jgi:hypothetical protein